MSLDDTGTLIPKNIKLKSDKMLHKQDDTFSTCHMYIMQNNSNNTTFTHIRFVDINNSISLRSCVCALLYAFLYA
jgi:hypothetical protein